jgi:anti-sigma28 factor (negative regulator of flagellin synthesis)
MSVGAIGNSYQAAFRKIDNARNDQSKSKSSSADNSSISQDAVDLGSNASSVETVRAQVAMTSELREEKLAEVREKIRTGQYNDPEVIDNLAAALAKSIFIP